MSGLLPTLPPLKSTLKGGACPDLHPPAEGYSKPPSCRESLGVEGRGRASPPVSVSPCKAPRGKGRGPWLTHSSAELWNVPQPERPERWAPQGWGSFSSLLPGWIRGPEPLGLKPHADTPTQTHAHTHTRTHRHATLSDPAPRGLVPSPLPHGVLRAELRQAEPRPDGGSWAPAPQATLRPCPLRGSCPLVHPLVRAPGLAPSHAGPPFRLLPSAVSPGSGCLS